MDFGYFFGKIILKV